MHLDLRRKTFRNLWFIIGLILAVVFSLATLIGPILAPHDPDDMSFLPLSPPSSENLLGVNDGGMDIFTELLYGLRNTLSFGMMAGLMGLGFGVIIGIVSAWFGHWVDHFLMRLADILMSIPSIMVLILMAALFRPSPFLLALILSVMSWPTTAKACRAQALILKRSLHVQAAKQMGAGNLYIISRHLLTEMYPLYLIGFATKARMAIFMEASLAFLGLFDPTRKSLGMMISYALKFYYLEIFWNWLMPPILCLSLLMLTVTFLAISMEGVFDPRLRESW
jgi:peptide/nickel transport system permease protein